MEPDNVTVIVSEALGARERLRLSSVRLALELWLAGAVAISRLTVPDPLLACTKPLNAYGVARVVVVTSCEAVFTRADLICAAVKPGCLCFTRKPAGPPGIKA